MDCIGAAASLQKMMIAHSYAEKQVSTLDSHISDLSHQTLVSALDGNKSQDLHLSLRLSVCDGVRIMYHNYQNKKWLQVKETARAIIQNLEGDLDIEQTPSMTSSPTDGSISADKAADKWSMAFCEFYRDN